MSALNTRSPTAGTTLMKAILIPIAVIAVLAILSGVAWRITRAKREKTNNAKNKKQDLEAGSKLSVRVTTTTQVTSTRAAKTIPDDTPVKKPDAPNIVVTHPQTPADDGAILAAQKGSETHNAFWCTSGLTVPLGTSRQARKELSRVVREQYVGEMPETPVIRATEGKDGKVEELKLGPAEVMTERGGEWVEVEGWSLLSER